MMQAHSILGPIDPERFYAAHPVVTLLEDLDTNKLTPREAFGIDFSIERAGIS
jgi:hypothetical protein